MTNALNWSTPHTNLAAAIATASGALAANGQHIADRLAALGGAYDARYGASGGTVDLAKGAWLTAIAAAWTQADTIARGQLSPDPGALSFDAYQLGLLQARVGLAVEAAKSKPITVAVLSAALSDVSTAWDPLRTGSHADGLDSFLTSESSPGVKVTKSTSVRTLEREVYALVAQAVEWTAAVS